MTHPEDAQRVEIKDGDHTVAAADVSQQPGGTTRPAVSWREGHANRPS